MYCILNQDVQLRGWIGLPYAIVLKNPSRILSVNRTAFELLQQCDGSTEISDGNIINQLIRDGIVKPCSKSEYSLSALQSYRKHENYFFPSASWGITDRCNLRCRHCFIRSTEDCVNEFSVAESDRFLNDAYQTGIQTIALTGGEPLFHRDILSIIRKVFGYGMNVFLINTNGLLITPEFLAELKLLGCYPEFRISFDGLNTHDWMRNKPGAEEQAKQAILWCVENGFPVTIQMNVHRKNLYSLLPTAMLFQDIGVKSMRIIRTADAPGWKHNNLTLKFHEYFDAMLQFLDDYNKHSLHIDIDIWRFLTLFAEDRQYRITPIRHNCDSISMSLPVCEKNRNMISISASGDVYPCQPFTGYYRSSGISLGNVKQKSLQEILREGRYIDAVCETLGDLAYKNNTCGRCQYFSACCGGCRAMATLYGKGYESRDPMMCVFFHNNYAEKIRKSLQTWDERTLLYNNR